MIRSSPRMATSKPGLDTQLRGVGPSEEGLEKSMAFSAVRRALLGAESEDGDTDNDLGKYRVLERLGTGGMGAVFAAWDPELERRVALKVLTGGREAKDEQSLIMREAKAAAQLSHPNVVTVFEVGVAHGRVFLAMEYIAGQTLRVWGSEAPTATARIAVLLQAGRGLAAAHERGLVHRDFKPDNVLVDARHQAKVVDFGLAQSIADFLDSSSADAGTGEDRGAAITQTGPRSGTPDYMAPEQLQGCAANARSDQFAFAVTAWELLCGERPFESNERAVDPRGRSVSGVPRSVIQALTRALCADPADRFPSMELLLAEIDPTPRAAKRSRFMLGGAGLLTVGAVAWGMAARSPPAPPKQCTGALAQLDGIWGEEQRDTWASVFAAAAPQQAETLWTSTSDTLSRYADEWVAASTDACEATRVRGEQSDEMFTLRTRCLHGRLRSFAALTGRFATLDAKSVLRAPSAASHLPSIEACADPELLTAQLTPPPPEIEDEVEGVREQLASIQASEELGQYKLVGEAIPSVVGDALRLEYRALQAEATLLNGRVHERMAEYPEAQAALEQATLHATASRHDRVLAESLGLLALVVGGKQAKKAEGLAIADRAEAAIARIGGDAELTAQLASRRGETYLAAGDLQHAQEQFEAAVAQFTELKPGGAQLGDTLMNLAAAAKGLGDLKTSAALQDRSIAILERLHGPDHPAVGMALANRASLLNQLGRTEEARASYRRARPIFVARLGKEHASIAALDINLGNLELGEKNFAAARELLEDIPDRLQAKLPAEHPWVAQSLTSRGRMRVETGDLDAGRADIEQAIAILEKTSPESADLAIAQCRRAWTLGKQGAAAQAHKAFERAFTQFDRSLKKDAQGHPEVVGCRDLQAEVASPP